MANTINNNTPIVPKAAEAPAFNKLKTKSDDGTVGQHTTMDTVTLRQSSETAVTYSSSLSPEDMADKSYDMLRRLVTSMLEEQGIDFKIATGDTTIDLSTITQEEAQELVSDDGYFGIAQTSDRIVDFAIAAAGGDVSRLDAIKEGVESGFNEALDAFGGWLPDISYDTLDAVMEKLDAWAAEAEG